ncbi:mannose-1-phosphate guanylyltransferase/mannose-6-phosphate isomerase [Legionella antarctica]|nr:mannose-1-phosphate guanylyltransferase/mannose-6-phosphate isomerase [Legionella antarctica]
MTNNLYPVILAGGSGTRLWPLSRQNFPKQFLALNGTQSLLQQTMQRAKNVQSNQTLIVSNDAHYFLCQEQLQDFNTPTTYLLEPCARNTAPAIACAARHLVNMAGSDSVMLVLPSDHWIADDDAWKKAMIDGAHFAAENKAIVTFGIKPDSPKTGYGYIEAGGNLTHEVKAVLGFREKPRAEKAAQFITQGNYFWNSGMFVCTAGVYLDELQKYEPDIHQLSEQALTQAYHHHDFLRLNVDYFSQCTDKSIDYAIMEKTDKAVVIPVSMKWSDLGCWSAVADANQPDEQGNTITGKVVAQDSHNCLINSEDILVTTVGIHDQIIVATSDAILVADKQYSQQVKELVNALRKDHHQLTQDHQRVSRPWGFYEILAEGPAFKVKRLMVKPGAKLSLQMHQNRAEHWVVVGGEAEVINDVQNFRLSINQSTYIPQNTLHRLSNPGDKPLYVIEVQSGTYLGEDDIKRFDDIYSRIDVEPTAL